MAVRHLPLCRFYASLLGMTCVIPFEEIIMQFFSPLAGKNRFLFVRIRTQIVSLSLESNLRDPSAVPPIQINAGMPAGIAGNQPAPRRRSHSGTARLYSRLFVLPWGRLWSACRYGNPRQSVIESLFAVPVNPFFQSDAHSLILKTKLLAHIV